MSRRPLALVAPLVLAGCGAAISWPDAPPDDIVTRLEVQPGDPIAGERVWLVLPTERDGECAPWSPAVSRERDERGVSLTVTSTTEQACPVVEVGGGGQRIDLGMLDEGQYRLRVDRHELAFAVRPADTDPGPPPLWWRAAHAVSAATGLGHGCPSHPDSPPEPSWAERAPRLYHQVRHAHPEWSDAQVQSELCVAQSIMVREVSPTELRYRVSGGELCRAVEYIGRIRVREDGSLQVEPPQVLSARDVIC